MGFYKLNINHRIKNLFCIVLITSYFKCYDIFKVSLGESYNYKSYEKNHYFTYSNLFSLFF